MKNKIIAANWKSNMTKDEAKLWLNEISLALQDSEIEIIIFPPFTLLDMLSSYIKVNDLPLALGAQDVSKYSSGSYTGEVSASQVAEFADYVLVGHSERRENQNELDEDVNKKIEMAVDHGLKPIVCISKIEQVKVLISDKIMLAYEPISAIGTGNPEDPQVVFQMAQQIQQIKNYKIIYGGSVDSQNANLYLKNDSISGLLIGKNSLDASSFINILKNVY
jgi:triosephosphate isomerase (TIM)